MRIGIDVTASIYSGTGVATYCQQLVPELLRIGKKHEFVLFGYALRRYRDLTLATKKLFMPPRLMEFLWNRLHVVPIERFVGDVDVFHAWDYLQPPTRNAHIVTTIHDLTALKFPMYHHLSTVEAQKRRLQWVRKEAALIIADSEATKRDIMEHLHIEENKIRVIYLAPGKEYLDFVTLSESKKGLLMTSVREKYHIDGPYLIAAGTREPRKNLKRLIDAFSLPRSTSWGMSQLVIVGNVGWGEELPQRPNVRLLGRVPHEDLPALMAGSSTLVYPSLYEGFGLPVVEAMAVGCPVVTTDRGSLKEIAGSAAVLVDAENVESIAHGIETALEKRSALIRKGLKRAEKFSWETAAQETLGVYETVIE